MGSGTFAMPMVACMNCDLGSMIFVVIALFFLRRNLNWLLQNRKLRSFSTSCGELIVTKLVLAWFGFNMVVMALSIALNWSDSITELAWLGISLVTIGCQT